MPEVAPPVRTSMSSYFSTGSASRWFVPNPLVWTDRWLDEMGRVIHGERKTGEAAQEGKALLAKGEADLSLLDREVDSLVWELANLMPGCLSKTVESLRKHKLEHWDRNRETNRAWLGLNMMTEANAGFRAFNEGPKGRREVDFLLLRRRLAEGAAWSEALIEEVLPK